MKYASHVQLVYDLLNLTFLIAEFQFKCPLMHLFTLCVVFQTLLNLGSLNKSTLLRMNPSTCAQSCETLYLLKYTSVYDNFKIWGLL